MENIGFTPHEPVDAEDFFTKFVPKAGGQLVADLIKQPPRFFNADFYFATANVVIELKCFKTDFPSIATYEKKIHALYESWIKVKKVNFGMIWGREQLPREFIFEFLRLFRPPVKRILEKANKQIKNTKKELELDSAQGLVVIINDGFYGFEPRYIFALISDILTHLYTSIDGFVFLTLNRYVDIPGDDYARQLWLTSYSGRANDHLVDFVNDLGRKWWDHFEDRFGKFDSRIESDDGNKYINQARFIK